MYERIVVGYDGSEGSKAALNEALRLAKKLGSEVTALWVRGRLVHYAETIDEVDEEKEAADAFFNKLKNEIEEFSKQRDISVQAHSEWGHPAKAIMDYAKSIECNLIVLGHKGHSGLWGNFLGHTADKVSENAHCSVLIVRQSVV
jgi:nucleotide-binding universal stress UspA family protein